MGNREAAERKAETGKRSGEQRRRGQGQGGGRGEGVSKREGKRNDGKARSRWREKEDRRRGNGGRVIAGGKKVGYTPWFSWALTCFWQEILFPDRQQSPLDVGPP